MAMWSYRFKMRDLLTRNEEDYAEIGRAMAKRLRARRKIWGDDAADDLAYAFEHVESVDEFESVLDELYDIAHDRRIWCE